MGQERVRVVVETGEPEGEEARIFYRDAETEEWTQFQGELAEMIQGKMPGERMSTLCHKFGSLVITRVEGFAIPKGMTQQEALLKYAPSIVAEIGELAFVSGGGRKIDLGKSGKPPASSLTDVSAPSSEATANTSS